MTEIINKLEQYSLSFKNIEKIINRNIFKSNLLKNDQGIESVKTKHLQEEKKTNTKSNLRKINEKDKLFWMFYQFLYDYDKYIMLGPNKFSEEMNTKTSWIQLLKSQKSLLKQHKIKFNNLEETLMYKKTTVQTLFPIIVLEHLNFIFYTKNTVFIYKKYENKKTFCLSFINKTFTVEDEKDIDIEKLQNDKFVINNLTKPLLAISNYKVGDIREIAEKLNISVYKDINKKKFIPKNDLYKLIKQTLIIDQ